MKCTRCGAEVEAQRFCIYCGERLHSRDNIHVQRAPSGVMRMRHRANISQTSLPEIQQKNIDNLQETSLASLSSSKNLKVSHEEDIVADVSSQMIQRTTRPSRSGNMRIKQTENVNSTEGNDMKDQGQSLRQSKELEALLFKLNGSSCEQKAVSKSSELDKSLVYDESMQSMENIFEENESVQDNSLENFSRTYSDEDYKSFFELNETEENDDSQDVSSTIPVGSGSFARIPSGGFHLVVDSIRSACSGMIARIKSLRKTSSRTNAENPSDVDNEYSDNTTDNSHRIAKFAIMVSVLVAIIAVIVSVASSGTNTEQNTEIAAQTPVAGNEDFAILPLDDPDEEFVDDLTTLSFEDDDFSIPALEGMDENDIEPAGVIAVEDDTIAAAETTNQPSNNRLTEIRLYNHNDNVMAQVAAGESFKTKNSCIMREGPASRFGLVKQVPAGATIQILTTVEEDWIIQGGSVWTKDGQPSKLGPGSQFANALNGMKLPQPKSRVISAKNWKYVQFGNVYGYVGPACFK